MSTHSPDIQKAITAYLDAARARGLSVNTLASYRYDLESFARHVDKDVAQLSTADILAYLEKKKKKKISGATRQRQFSSLNSFYRWLVREDFLKSNPMEYIKPGPSPKRHSRPLPHESVMHILEMISPAAIRDRTLFMLLYETGLRVREVLNIRISDLDLIAGNEMVHLWSRNARSERLFPLIVAPMSIQLLHHYLEQARVPPKGPLFPGRRTSGNRHLPLEYSAAHAAWKKYCQAAGISATLQQLRRSRITSFFEAGVSIFAIQQLMGHRSAQSTLRYEHTVPDTAFLFEQARQYEQQLAKERWALISPLIIGATGVGKTTAIERILKSEEPHESQQTEIERSRQVDTTR